MKFYKVRSLNNLEFVVDILFNERLYCAHFADLNDPFEGIYLSGARFPQEVVERIDLEQAAFENPDVPVERREFNRICVCPNASRISACGRTTATAIAAWR